MLALKRFNMFSANGTPANLNCKVAQLLHERPRYQNHILQRVMGYDTRVLKTSNLPHEKAKQTPQRITEFLH